MSYFSVQNSKSISLGKCKYIFSDEKVKITTKYFATYIDWTYFQLAKETSNYFVLFMKDGHRNLIPKRAFENYEQISNFKNLLREKLGDEAYLKKTKEKLGLK